jgi:hypothetical protein
MALEFIQTSAASGKAAGVDGDQRCDQQVVNHYTEVKAKTILF